MDAPDGAVTGTEVEKFEEVYGRSYRGELSQGEASEILGVSERTLRRWRDRYEAEGAEGLYDRRLGRASARAWGSTRCLRLFETRYTSLPREAHGFGLSYNWLRLIRRTARS